MLDRRSLRLALLATCLLPATAALAATGGPDAFGYTWADSNEPGVTANLPQNLDTGPFPLGLVGNKDTVSPAQNFGFSFPYYGATYTQFKVSSNGWITLDTSVTSSFPTPQSLPLSAPPNNLLAFYWRGLDAPTQADWGTFNGDVVIRFRSTIPGGGDLFMGVILYKSGLIKYVYGAVDQQSTVSVGIENGTGTTGLNPWYLGTGENGFLVQDLTAILFFPPPKLTCAAAAPIACGQKLTFSTPPSGTVNNYFCSPNTYNGNEKVITFNNPGLSDVTITLSNLPVGVDMDVMLLRLGQCNESQCLDWNDTKISRTFLGKGTYQIVVDGKKATDVGNFDLQVDCVPKSAVLPCQAPGAPPVRGTTSGTSVWDFYDCTNQTEDGPEFIYEIPFTAPGNLKATFTPDPGISLDLMVFGPNSFNAPNACLQWADNDLTLFNPPSGTYYLVVDGRSNGGVDPNAGGFSLGVRCDALLSCTTPVGDLTCFKDTMGTTLGGVDRAEQYSCSTDLFTGPEVVYKFRNDVQRTVGFLFNGSPDLSMFLIPQTSCNEGACKDYGNGRLVTRDLPVGDYYLVVDGKSATGSAFTVTPICGNLVNPATGAWTLNPGESVHETKLATVNADITRGDVVFDYDMTGSMGRNVGNLKTTSKLIINELSKVIDDVQFGLVSFEDYPDTYNMCGYNSSYGGGADRPYRLNLPITNDQAALTAAIDGLVQGGGNDLPEAYLRVWYEMYADATNIGWRPSSRRIAIMFGDDEPHLCDTDACGSPRTSTGIDPGRDGIAGTADDLDMTNVMAQEKKQGIIPIYLFAGNAGKPGLLDPWKCWTGKGAGFAFDAPGANAPANLIKDLRRLIEDKSLICNTLEVRPSTGYEAWVTNIVPLFLSNVFLPVRATFDFDIGPPVGTGPGVYSFLVDIVCDGIVKASQSVTLTIPGTCTPPVGRIGNAVRATKNGGVNVDLDWRTGALVNPNYNIHRFGQKTQLPNPPMSPVPGIVGNTALDKYTDPGGVSAPGTYFYQVYGRDCSGQSLTGSY